MTYNIDNADTSSRLRISMSLDKDQAKNVEEHLDRATCFWNLMVDMTRSMLDRFYKGDYTLYEDVENLVKELEHLLKTHGAEERDYKQYNINEKWNMGYMAELSNEELEARRNGFMSTVCNSVSVENSCYRPRIKNNRSTQATTFPVSKCEIRDNHIFIDGKWPINIPLGRDVDLTQYKMVTIGKRRPPTMQEIKRWGPSSEDYYVLFN